jgi:hypothetical protein
MERALQKALNCDGLVINSYHKVNFLKRGYRNFVNWSTDWNEDQKKRVQILKEVRHHQKINFNNTNMFKRFWMFCHWTINSNKSLCMNYMCSFFSLWPLPHVERIIIVFLFLGRVPFWLYRSHFESTCQKHGLYKHVFVASVCPGLA